MIYKEKKTPSRVFRSILLAFILACLMKFFLFDFMLTEGRSMIPAIRPGTILFVNRIAYGFRLPWTDKYLIRWKIPKSGEIVVFYNPLGEIAVKRCLDINEYYMEDRFFLQGDNDQESFDSRSYGPIPMDRILGKVLGVK